MGSSKAELRNEVVVAKDELRGEIAGVRSDVRLLKWQVTASIALASAALAANGATLWFVMRLVAKLGA